MGDEACLKEVIRELEGVKNSIDTMSNKFDDRMKSLEERVVSNIELTKSQVDRKQELFEKEVRGMSTRLNEKITEHEDKLHVFETCQNDCATKRHGIHERIDVLRDDKILPLYTRVEKLENYLKAAWIGIGILGAIIIAVGSILLEKALR